MRFLFSLLLFLSSLGLVAQNTEKVVVNPNEMFELGNKFYEEGNFVKALESYNIVVAAGKTSCDLHQNLGNTYFRLDSLGKAILHYEKAIKINPSHTAAQENLEFSRDFISQKAGVWPDVFYKQWLRGIIGVFSAFVWWILAVALVWLALFFAKKYLNADTQKSQKSGFYAAITTLVFSVIFLIFGISRYQWQADDSYAIVITELLEVKSGPAEKSKGILKISEGNKLQIIEVTPEGWCKIQLPDGQKGWMHQRDFERI